MCVNDTLTTLVMQVIRLNVVADSVLVSVVSPNGTHSLILNTYVEKAFRCRDGMKTKQFIYTSRKRQSTCVEFLNAIEVVPKFLVLH